MLQQRHQIEITTLDQLATMRRHLTRMAGTLGAKPEKVADLVLAANEAITNIFEHGFQGERCKIELLVAYSAGILSLTILDDGPHFDPTEVVVPDPKLPLGLRKTRGMGILMIRDYTDRIHYTRTKEAQNRLVLEIGDDHGN